MHLLKGLKPGNIVVACFALESAAKLARLHGYPITRQEAEQWLADATEICDPAWVVWRLDGIADLA